MYSRIEITYKDGFNDGREKGILELIKEDSGLVLQAVKIVDVYNLLGQYKDKELEQLINELFCDPVFQEGAIGFHAAKKNRFDYGIEVAYKPGVTDNVGRTAARGIEYVLQRQINPNDVRSSRLYLFKGDISKNDAAQIAGKVLCNELIECYTILSYDDVQNGQHITYSKQEEKEIEPPYFNVINLEVSGDELMNISSSYILSLSLEEMMAIRDYYRRDEVKKSREKRNLPLMPTDIELEVFAQTWSEHCKHKIFAADIEYRATGKTQVINSLFKTYIQKSTELIKQNRPDLLSIFVDNAGVVRFNDEFAYCVKVETHNSPSALDPYGGAMTGIVGVNRDIIGTGMGALPIFNTDVFCFASPFTPENEVYPGLLHPRRIFRGVHRGIKDGGNESGIPTVNGSITFDPSFIGKPLVFCGTGGILPLKIREYSGYLKYYQSGDLIVMVGGRIGKDGIHGATFSSVHLSETSPTSAVQIGDPITQKKMLDFLIEARDLGLYTGLTDNGAGGLSSSVGEMATRTGGAVIYLEKCPLKYSGLRPWEILLSEAQERMSVAVPADKVEKFLQLSQKRDVDSTVIGAFTDSGYFECYYNNVLICSIDLTMLHDGVPRLKLKAEWNPPQQKRLKEQSKEYQKMLRALLGCPNIASKEYWVRIYDHEVQARTVGKPFCGKDNDGPADGAVLKLFPGSNEGLVITHGIIPRYSKLDSYQMAANAIDEAYRSAVLLGADPDQIVGLDNFCWPDPVESDYTPDGQYKLAQLVRANQAVYDITTRYNCPCISGKDSMKNDYKRGQIKVSILPTLLFTAVGKINDITCMTTPYFKKPGTKIYLIGATRQELGASEYYSLLQVEGGIIPTVDPEKAIRLYRKLALLIKGRLLLSCHDLSDGGLAVAIAESAFSGNIGARINLDQIDSELTIEEKLFAETPSRILVTLNSENESEFLKIMQNETVYYLGETIKEELVIISSGQNIILQDNLSELKTIWGNALVF